MREQKNRLTEEEIRILETIKSERAVEYFRNKTNLGEIKNAESFEYTGACGEKMTLYLSLSNGIIKDSKFQYEGCPGLACCGSALCELTKGRTIEEAKKITKEDILEHLKASPMEEFDCPVLAVKTLEKVIEKYK